MILHFISRNLVEDNQESPHNLFDGSAHSVNRSDSRVIDERVNEFFRDTVSFYGSIDLCGVVAVVTESIENLRQREMRQMPRNLFRGNTLSPEFDYRPHRRSRVSNDRFTAEDLVVRNNVVMFNCCSQ